MDAPFGFLQIEAMFFGPMDDCVQGDFLTIGLLQTVSDIAVVIRRQGNFFVPNDFLFDG
jgi:hypothetical protein